MKDNIQISYKHQLAAWLFFALFTLLRFSAAGQSSCFEVRFSTITAQPGDTIEVAVTVRGFTKMLGYQFAAEWSPADLQFIRHSNAGSLLGSQLINPLAGAQGILRTIWSDETVQGVTLPDNAYLFKMYFKVLATTPGFYPIRINPNNNPTVYEFTAVYPKDLPLSHIVGGARVGATNSFSIDTLCVITPPCAGNLGGAHTVVSGGVAPYSYQWTGPNGFVSTDNDLSGLPHGIYRLTITDNQGIEVQAMAEISSNGSTVQISAVTENATCEAPNGCVQLLIFNGYPPYHVAWSTPGTPATNRCDLVSGSHKATVTDNAGCMVVKEFYIGKNTEIQVNLSAAYADCRFGQRGSISVTANGTAPYSYVWSNGATSAPLDNLLPGTYSVSVVDAQGCADTASVLVKDYGTFDWDFNLYSACPAAGPVPLSLWGYALAQRVKPPLFLSWDNGTRQEIQQFDPSQTWEALSNFTDVPFGSYAVTITDADGCTQAESKEAFCFVNEQIDEFEPLFYLEQDNILGQISVRSKGFRGAKKVQFSLSWNNTYMKLDTVSANGYFSGFGTTYTFYPDIGRLDFKWEYGGPFGFFSSTPTLFTLKFKDNTSSSARINFSENANKPFLFEHYSEGVKPFIGRLGTVKFEYQGTLSDIPDFNLTKPSCAYEGYRRLVLNNPNATYSDPYGFLSAGLANYGVFFPKSDLLFAKPGQFYFYSSSGGSFSVSIPPYSLPASECVWPGDADNNSTVNHFDLLYMGLGMGSTGAPRLESDSLWQGADAPDWPQQTTTHPVNFKNMDMDGDGTISAADTTTLLRHWGKKIDNYDGFSPYKMPASPDITLDQTRITITTDTVRTGSQVSIPISMSAGGIHGLAFSVSYDPLVVLSGVRFEPTHSWLGDPAANLIQVQRDFFGQRRLDVALTRTDGLAASGSGEFGRLVLTFKPLSPDTLRSTTLFVSRVVAITPTDTLIGYGETRKQIILRGSLVSGTANPPVLEGDITLAPNPAADEIRFLSRQNPIRHILITNSNGTLWRDFDWEMPAQNVPVDVRAWPPGTYFARVVCADGVVVKRFVVAR